MTNNKMRWMICVAALALAGTTSQAQSQPMIPFNTSFSHSEHHWIMWIPKHPVYEAIEVRSNDNPQSPNGKSITVFFTERAGGKNQVYYFNEESAAKRWTQIKKQQAYFRDIEYRTEGTTGKPMSLFVKFKDKDDISVELTMQFGKDQELTTEHAGLANQMGHGAEALFMIFYREKVSTATRSQLLIGGEDFSTKAGDAGGTEQMAHNGYRSNIYVATIAYGKSSFSWDENGLTNSWRRVFKRVANTGKDTIYRSNKADDQTVIELVTNSAGEIRQYKHLLGEHTYQIEFEPALPNLNSAKTGQSVNYRISLDNFKNLVEGVVSFKREETGIVLDWQHQTPNWTKGYFFQSIIRPNSTSGYDLEVVRKK